MASGGKVQVKVKPQRWYLGGIAGCMTVCFTHPLDLVKVHLQTQQSTQKGMLNMFGHVLRTDGVRGLYNGLTASWARQLTYTTARVGVYEFAKNKILKDTGGQMPPFYLKVSLSSLGGFCGGLVGTPADMINVRMQNDMKLPVEQRRNYKHIFDGMRRIVAEEGVLVLWSGVSMNVVRSVLMTVGQLAFYDQAKQALMGSGYFVDNLVTHFCSSVIAGAAASALTQPADVLKTRMMNERLSLSHFLKYTWEVGPLGFYKGYVPAFVRLAPHTILMFMFLEQLRRLFPPK